MWYLTVLVPDICLLLYFAWLLLRNSHKHIISYRAKREFHLLFFAQPTSVIKLRQRSGRIMSTKKEIKKNIIMGAPIWATNLLPIMDPEGSHMHPIMGLSTCHPMDSCCLSPISPIWAAHVYPRRNPCASYVFSLIGHHFSSGATSLDQEEEPSTNCYLLCFRACKNAKFNISD